MAILSSQQLFKLLILFYCFFISLSSISEPQHSWHESKILHDFGDNFVRGISQYGSILAFALEDKIVFEKPSDAKGAFAVNKIGNITLAENLHDKNRFLEFKIINENSVLVCNPKGCSVCKKTADDEPDCEQLKFPHTSFDYVTASLVDEKIFIRIVSTNKTLASIYVFEPTKTSKFEMVKWADDKHLLSEFTAVAAFSTLTHTFFVGSVYRKDLAMMGSIDVDYNRVNHELRITRICNNDQTKNLDSRIDLTLACQGDDYDNLEKSIHNVATAAIYFPDNGKLIISIKSQNKNTTICEFDVEKIQERFDHTWNLCQSDFTTDDNKRKKCQDKNYLELPDDCFIFTMQKSTPLPFCQSVNNRKGADPYENCNLHISNNTARRYTWLENYKPFFGKPIYKGSLPSFVVLRESNDPSTLFAIDEDNRMRRIQLDPTKIDNTLMWRPARRGPHMLEYLKPRGQLLFVNPRGDNIINNMQISCVELYQSCNNISWEDPLNCGFCVNRDGSGIVMPEGKLICQTGNFMKNVCPPSIDFYKFTDGDYVIHGQNFEKLKNPQITACTGGCDIISYQDNYILCRGSSQRDKSCNVTIIGELNQKYPRFALQKSFDENKFVTNTTTEDPKAKSHMKSWRYVGFAAAFIILVAVIVALYCLITKRFTNKIKNKANKARGKLPFQDNASPIEHYNVVPGIPLDEIHEGTIRLSQLKFIRKIGEGNSAEVRLAEYRQNINDANFIEVAVKITRAQISEDEARKEIEMVKGCKHENIVGFIGWTRENYSIFIVTEFMRGGSVQEYLRDPTNKPTIGQCFSYITQILEGMVYLSHKHVVHRDLATRNCLLNSTYENCKISDFGLSRQTDNNYEYVSSNNPRLPYRWLPLEALLNDKTFTVKGDVWSFGVVIWELFQRGAVPYDGLDMQGVVTLLDSGKRLEKPQYCPPDLYTIMMCCWDQRPESRPTFDTLKIQINNILHNFSQQNPDQINSEYERPTPVRNIPPSTIGAGSSRSGSSITAVV